MDRKVRFGVIGLSMGGAQAMNVKSLPEMGEVAALVDIDRARLDGFAGQFGPDVRKFTDYREMLEMDDLDAVIVATPNYLHKEMTVAALGAGKHVLCQKPPAMNARETSDMFDAAEKSGRILMISLNQRFEYSNLWLKNLVDNGELGEPYYASAGWLRRRVNPAPWFTDKSRSGGGPLIDLGVHVLDVAMFLMGYPKVKSVKAQVVNKMTPAVTVEDLVQAFIEFENGGAMTLANSMNLNVQRERVWCEIAGTKGGLQTYPPVFFTEKAGEHVDLVPVQAGYEPHVPQDLALMKHFIDCVNTGKQPMVTRDQMMALTRVLDAIYRSGETGKEVPLGG